MCAYIRRDMIDLLPHVVILSVVKVVGFNLNFLTCFERSMAPVNRLYYIRYGHMNEYRS